MVKLTGAKGEPLLDPEAEASINQITQGLGDYLRILLRKNHKAQTEKGRREGGRAGSS
jgi:hypothetical protein